MTFSTKTNKNSLEPLSEEAMDALTEEAAEWCMRMHSQDCSDKDKKAFQQWRESSTHRATEYDAIEKLWGLSSELSEALPPLPKKPH